MWSKKRVSHTPRSLKRPAVLLKRRISTVDKSHNIKVVVRVRPPNEKDSANRQVVQVIDDNCLIFDPKEDEDNFYVGGHKQLNRDMLKKRNKNIEFQFDRIFDEESNNQDVFEGTTQNLIGSLLDGFNCSVFVYGATGAGKTYTMLGSKKTPGIAYLTMVELYKNIEENSDSKFDLKISYLEVYNEMVKDLICPSGPLPLRDDGKDGVIIPGIKMHHINSAEELFQMLEYGNRNRTQHPTDANAESSRSHAIFQVHLSITHKLTLETKVSKLTMIDLAGSERGAATGGKGARFSEGSNINKSLLALGNCVDALAEGQKHVPYRNSKLTRILKDSLGGNCRTVMIVNVSPGSISYEETFNTLSYATRAKKISNRVRRNLHNVDMSAAQYKKIIEELKQKNEELQNDIKLLKEGKDLSNDAKDYPREHCPDIAKGRHLLRCLYDLEGQYRKELLMYQIKKKTLDWRIHQKQVISERFQLFEYMLGDSKSKSRMDDSVANLKSQRRVYKTKVKSIQKLLREKRTLREVALKDIKAKGLMGELQKDVDYYAGKMKQDDLEMQVKYFKDLLLKQQHEMANSDSIITELCKTMDYYYSILNGSNQITERMKDQYLGLVQQLSGMKGVSWEDEPCEYSMLRRVIDLSFISEDSTCSVASVSGESDYICRKESTENTPVKKEIPLSSPVFHSVTPVTCNYRVPATPSVGLENIAQYVSEGEETEVSPCKEEVCLEKACPISNVPVKPDFNKTFCVVPTLNEHVQAAGAVVTQTLESLPEETLGVEAFKKDVTPVVLNTTFDNSQSNECGYEENVDDNSIDEQTSGDILNVTFKKSNPSPIISNIISASGVGESEAIKSSNLHPLSVLNQKLLSIRSNLPVIRNISTSGSSQKPGSGSSQKPGSGSGQKPGSGSGQKPGSGSGQKPGSGSGQKSGSGSRCQQMVKSVKEKQSQPNEIFKVRPGATIKIQYNVLSDKNKMPPKGIIKNHRVDNGKKIDMRVPSSVYMKENQALLPFKSNSSLGSPQIGNIKFDKPKSEIYQDRKMRV